ncbi:short-chain dehydrogenase/reductase SDR [Halteromyces radiatus]|uniref:short-chain dehydrogenase/reductase SDR n=1 Tax=Halteromyces radiatus TaxID=101107 RepID=UPI002220C5B4|nr:short-chain dehydrogenase/reductase SDR [Halteromyces radiatus]KAI8077817.1 short-chain dehydrogenase/reductase SDR [Halteromyces radiatus]
MKVEGNLYIVTGGAGGIGKQVVKTLIAKKGYAVIFDLNETFGKLLVEELGGKNVFVPGSVDCTDEAQVEKALAAGLEHFKGIPLAGTIICHGVLFPPPSLTGYGPTGMLTGYKQFEFYVRVNFLGCYLVAQKVAEHLIKNEPFNEDNERGIIITTTSISALDGTMVGYGAAKSGVAGLTLPLAKELAPHGIRVMSIAPGPFDTPILDPFPQGSPPCPHPKRIGKPQEFADLCISIIDNRMLNGSVIRLDGAFRFNDYA